MSSDFDEFKVLLLKMFPRALAKENGVIYFNYENTNIACVHLLNDPDLVFFRARVIALSEVKREGEFIMDALSSNFFWSGNMGANLSIGPDDIMYMTDKCLIEDFQDNKALINFLDDFTEAVANWQVRSTLYA